MRCSTSTSSRPSLPDPVATSPPRSASSRADREPTSPFALPAGACRFGWSARSAPMRPGTSSASASPPTASKSWISRRRQPGRSSSCSTPRASARCSASACHSRWASAPSSWPRSDWLVVSGYLLLERAAGISSSGDSPRRVLLGCSLASTEVAGWLEPPLALRPHLAVLNAAEARAICGADGPPPALARGVADRLAAIASSPTRRRGRVSRWAVGEISATSGGPAVDTTGAGDAFSAGLIADLSEADWPPDAGRLERAMASAVDLAAAVARVPGHRAGSSAEGPA